MIAHINLSIVIFFVALLIISIVVLLLITPSAVKEYSTLKSTKAKGVNFDKRINGLSAIMEELSRCRDVVKVKRLIEMVQDEVDGMLGNNVIQIKKRDSVQSWLDSFSIEAHIDDLKRTNKSQQIIFDTAKKDFKLTILKK